MIETLLIVLNGFAIGFASLKNRYDIADVIWGLNILLFCFYFSLKNSGISIALVCVLVWGLRLSYHIGRRFIHKESMDIRYTELLKNNTSLFGKNLKVFGVQIVLAFLMSATFWESNLSGNNLKLIIGLCTFVFGLGFEIIADYQLKEFIADKNNRGKILQTGLYSVSRHPNYFGEVLLWWGIWIMSSFNLIGLITPLLISFLILKVSGIPMSESYLSKKEGFEEYSKKTNLFIPWKRK